VSLKRRAFLIAVPAALGILLLAHPTDPPPGEAIRSLAGEETRWLIVHVGLLIALPSLGLWIWLALDGVANRTASLARVAIVFFVAFYTAFDALVGIATGVLVRETLSLTDDGTAAQLVEEWWAIPTPVWVFSALGPLSWLVTAGAAAIAHLRAGSGSAVVGGLAVAAPLFAFGHPTVAGPLAMVALVLAAIRLQPHSSDSASEAFPAD